MAEPYVGQIILVGFNFAPAGYAVCDGQLLLISQNETLFQLIGTTYGGDGQTTFALPDLRGRVPIHMGGPALGQSGGSETETLTSVTIPAHTHTLDVTKLTASIPARNGLGTAQSPAGAVLAADAGGTNMYSAAPNANMHSSAVSLIGSPAAATAGGNQPHENMQPFLVMNYCIALTGIFPPQN
jgi:microcystin-dependent protein